MSVPITLNVALKKRPGGQIINMLDWAINGGLAKWCDDVTYSADKTLTQAYITANNFTVDSGVTLTLSQLMPLIVVADTITVNGTITASGKGCSHQGYRCIPTDYPLFGFFSEEISHTRNYCFCGTGGGSSTDEGGGAYGTGQIGVGPGCSLTDAEIKRAMFSPLFNIFQIGLGGGGNGVGGGKGGGSILLLARSITVASTASILANGIDASGGNYGGGGGGFIGLIGDSLSVHGSATVTADGGAGDGTGYDGGDGTVVQIEI